MIISKDIKPERQIYRLGALLLEVLQSTPNRNIELFGIRVALFILAGNRSRYQCTKTSIA